MQETWVWSLGWEDPLEEGMATHSSVLVWRIPWTEEPGRLWSQRVRYDWSGLACMHNRIIRNDFCNNWWSLLKECINCGLWNDDFLMLSFFLWVSLVAQMVKEPACKAGDSSSISGSGRWPGEGYGHPLQCSCLENPMDRGAWQALVHEVTKSRTGLSDNTFTFFLYYFYLPILLTCKVTWF